MHGLGMQEFTALLKHDFNATAAEKLPMCLCNLFEDLKRYAALTCRGQDLVEDPAIGRIASSGKSFGPPSAICWLMPAHCD